MIVGKESMKNIKYSVVIPLFNKEKHIKRAIKSVLSQTIENFELLIIDDGSTDNSLGEAKEIVDSRVRIIKQRNMGVSAARNKGIDEARNNFIGFLDADDEWKPNFLTTIEDLIKNFPKAGAYATSYYIKIKDGIVKKSPCEQFFSKKWRGILDDYFKYAINGPIITASSVVIPKEVFVKVGYFPLGIKKGEDLEMWRRIAIIFDIAYSNQSCAVYHLDAANRACEKEHKLVDSIASFPEEIFLELEKRTQLSNYYYEYIIENIIADKARYLTNEGRKKEARSLLYKYSHTKFNKKLLLKVFLISFLPKNVLQYYYDTKKSFINKISNTIDH